MAVRPKVSKGCLVNLRKVVLKYYFIALGCCVAIDMLMCQK